MPIPRKTMIPFFSRIVVACAFAIAFCFIAIVVVDDGINQSLHPILFVGVTFSILAGVLLMLVAWCAESRRLAILGGCIIVLGYAGMPIGNAWFWWKVERFEIVDPWINWWAYRPFTPGNKLIQVEVTPEQRMAVPLPRISGAYAFYPVYAAAVQAIYPPPDKDDSGYRSSVDVNGSDEIFTLLLQGDVDLIFSLAPSKQQLQDAAQLGFTYEMTPYAAEAFVFFVNRQNPIETLTSKEVRGIYSGAITDWQQLGAPKAGKILPFQRNEGSGSQTALQTIMGDTPIIPPLEADRLRDMEGIIRDIADYRNYPEAIGFSFRYYVLDMAQNPGIKILPVDGIIPTPETIADGTYPFIFTSYIITARPRSENTQKFIRFMLSPQGREIIEKTGYVPLSL